MIQYVRVVQEEDFDFLLTQKLAQSCIKSARLLARQSTWCIYEDLASSLSPVSVREREIKCANVALATESLN
jgi:hypothetical protein